MKRGKTIGNEFLFLVGEGLFRLKRELWGLRGIGVLFTVAYLIIDAWTTKENIAKPLAFQGIGAMWLIFLFPPRMGKLLYLLPFSRKERKNYFFMYACVYLFYLIAAFFLIGGAASFLTGYPYYLWLKWFFLCTLPFIIVMSGSVVSSLVSPKKSIWFYSTRGWYFERNSVEEIREEYRKDVKKKKKEEMTKEELRDRRCRIAENTVIVVCMLVVVLQACAGGAMMLLSASEAVIAAGSVLSYICAAGVLTIVWRGVIKELYKTESSGKEGYGCNL
ncbi:MAG: hypothetical protein J1E35_06680 [Lachnospiraceae bacterium]|nr:hypothetical protein [Lachnospiraceae bacterium]